MASPYLSNKRICVTGGAGFLGRAVCAALNKCGVSEIFVPRSREYDLTKAEAVARLFDEAVPNIVIHLAAEVGGIGANQKQPGRFFFANLAMGLHLIEEARRRGIEKFVQVGTACAYPNFCEVPFREGNLWEGYPQETNAPYGVAKRALGVMLDAYRVQYGFNGIYLIPANLYGPGDNFDPETSHVIPGLIRKFCEAVDSRAGTDVASPPCGPRSGQRPPQGADATNTVTCWGSGRASREFLYVDDAAEAIVKATEIHNDSHAINLGTGREITIEDLATLIARLTGFTGRIFWDTTRPDGQPRRRLDTTRATSLLSWWAGVELDEGIRRTIEWWRGEILSREAVGDGKG